MNTKTSLPDFGWQLPLLLGVLFLALIGCVAGFFVSTLVSEDAAQAHATRTSLLDEQERLALTVSRHAPRAMSGIESSFSVIRHASARSDVVLTALRQSYSEPYPALATLVSEWGGVRDAIELILGAEEPILGLRASLESLQTTAIGLEEHAQKLSDGTERWDFEPGQRYAASNLALMTTRLTTNFSRGLDANGSLIDSDQYRRDAQLLAAMGHVNTSLSLGDPSLGVARVENFEARGSLDAMGELFRQATQTLQSILTNTLVVVHVRETGETIAAAAERIPSASATLREAHAGEGASGGFFGDGLIRTAFAVVAVLLLIIIAITIMVAARSRVAVESERAEEARRRQEESSEINRRNQEAILTLLDEISALADGDLSTQATVTEDITGAIADAVNYAIEALREIVANINDTSVEVRSAAVKTRARAENLSQASQVQAQRISQANDALRGMSESVDRIAQGAAESSQVAGQSVRIANRGAGVVRDTLAGMNAIRETMQETSKRIKRLGESSQEIGDIVSLIDDIADQTNVLALNAAIQASMAGEAGRGFAVVADEVQRLAERAGQATKQIDALVKAIQSDTHEAVASMEQSTAGVVSGARVAAGAGEALSEIESVSARLAGRIEEITALTRDHTGQAGEIVRAMDGIREVTTETQTGTLETARSIGDLEELAEALRQSVEGFKLPERDFSATQTLPQQIAARRQAAALEQDDEDGLTRSLESAASTSADLGFAARSRAADDDDPLSIVDLQAESNSNFGAAR